MPLIVECYFQPQTQDGLMKVCRAISTAGVLPDRQQVTPRPCLELGMWDLLDFEAFEAKFAGFARSMRPLPITLASMGMFPTPERRLFLSPVPTRDLLEMHAQLHEQLRDFADQLHPAYQVDKWQPHVTLGTGADLNRLQQCVSVMQDLRFPISTQIVELGLRTFTA